MNLRLIAAGVIAIFIAIVHSVLGEQRIVQPLLRSDAFAQYRSREWFVRRTFQLAWHLTSLLMVGFGALLIYYSKAQPDVTVLEIISGVFILSAVLTAGATKGKHLAWPLFLAVGVLAGWFA
jgi:hypothetical protein